jgi:hypothetical protein
VGGGATAKDAKSAKVGAVSGLNHGDQKLERFVNVELGEGNFHSPTKQADLNTAPSRSLR